MPFFRTSLHLVLLIMYLLANGYNSQAQKLIPIPFKDETWSQSYPPFRVAGNLYYVGTQDLASYLITTPEGHILINTGLAEDVPLIRKNVEDIGYKFSDIKILLATHAHYDHVAGMAAIKKMTGAKLMINERDAPVVADGGNSDYLMGGKGSMFKSVKANRLLKGNDTIRLGGMKIIALHHPGHTKGATSFLLDAKDADRTYRVLIANMPSILDDVSPGMPTYPEVAKDYAYTLDAMRHIEFDLWLSSHASQFGLHNKRKPGEAYKPEVFRDRKGYDEALDKLKDRYDSTLGAKQQK